jgi:protein ImuA
VAAKKYVLWLRSDFAALEEGELSALGLLELGLDPARMLLLRAGDATSVLRAATDALSCKALGAIVIEIPGTPKILDLAASRRLVLASAQSGVTAFLLRVMAEPEASAAETRWLVRAARSSSEN